MFYRKQLETCKLLVDNHQQSGSNFTHRGCIDGRVSQLGRWHEVEVFKRLEIWKHE